MHEFVEAVDPGDSLSGIAFIRLPRGWRFRGVKRENPIETEA